MVSQQLQSLERVLKQDAGSRSAAGFQPASFGSGANNHELVGSSFICLEECQRGCVQTAINTALQESSDRQAEMVLKHS